MSKLFHNMLQGTGNFNLKQTLVKNACDILNLQVNA